MAHVTSSAMRTIRQHGLIRAGDRVAVALSGGSDSVALVWILRELAPALEFTLAGVIHVNHCLRGEESDADETFCRELAARIGVPIEVFREDVASLAKSRGVSMEVAARDARYGCFDRAAVALEATVVATGHTKDDQAETVLLRLLRGAGTRGLSGVRIRRGHFIRPLLDTRRVDLRRYLVGLGESWREDASNDDVAILRNRVRHELLPVVQSIAPEAVTALARLARLAQDDEQFLEAAANEKAQTLVLSDRSIDAAALGALPRALARRVVRRLAAEAAPDNPLSAQHLEAVCALAATDNPVGALDLPGLAVRKAYGRLGFEAPIGPRRRGSDLWPERVLTVPGFVELPEAGGAIQARLIRADEAAAFGVQQEGNADRVVIPGSVAAARLIVRNRRPGDRLRPLGAPGRRKLQDVFVDRKVPRHERDAVPIVTDENGEIVWVAGVALTERCRVRLPESGMLILVQRELRKHR